jgi:hypothetical protein
MSGSLMYRAGMQSYPDYVDITRLSKSSGVIMYNYDLIWADDENVTLTKEYTVEVQRLESSKEYRYFRVYILDNDFFRHMLCDFTIKMDDVNEIYIKLTDEGYNVSLTDVFYETYLTTMHSTIIMYLSRCTYEWATYLYYNYVETQTMVRDELLDIAEQEKKYTIH